MDILPLVPGSHIGGGGGVHVHRWADLMGGGRVLRWADLAVLQQPEKEAHRPSPATWRTKASAPSFFPWGPPASLHPAAPVLRARAHRPHSGGPTLEVRVTS